MGSHCNSIHTDEQLAMLHGVSFMLSVVQVDACGETTVTVYTYTQMSS